MSVSSASVMPLMSSDVYVLMYPWIIANTQWGVLSDCGVVTCPWIVVVTGLKALPRVGVNLGTITRQWLWSIECVDHHLLFFLFLMEPIGIPHKSTVSHTCGLPLVCHIEQLWEPLTFKQGGAILLKLYP